MARMNYRAIEREEDLIENDETLSNAEKMQQIRDLHREASDEFIEEQMRERDEAFNGY